MNHEFYIRRCLQLARKAAGRTSPNPMVGAVLVRDGKIIAEGYHQKAGLPHAEVMALKRVGSPLRDATLYVNLEPCCHQGRTPPCTEAILKAGVKEVVVGVRDPNRRVNGKGISLLRKKGVKIRVGLLEEECRALNEIYFKAIMTGRPFVILKVASTLDGMVATGKGDSRWITSSLSRRRVHELRDQVDAILVGANTVVRDNPRLTTRLDGRKGKNPLRIVLDSALYVDPDATVFKRNKGDGKWKPIVATVDTVPPQRRRLFEKAGIRLLFCRTTGGAGPTGAGRIDLGDLLEKLGQIGVTSLLVEGGPGVHSSFLRHHLVDKMLLFFSPRFLGGSGLPMFSGIEYDDLGNLPTLKIGSIEKVGADLLLTGYPLPK